MQDEHDAGLGTRKKWDIYASVPAPHAPRLDRAYCSLIVKAPRCPERCLGLAPSGALPLQRQRSGGRRLVGRRPVGGGILVTGGSPAAVEEFFPWGKEDFVGEQADEDDDEDDADDLVHGIQFAAEVEEVAEAVAADDGDVDFGGHE